MRTKVQVRPVRVRLQDVTRAVGGSERREARGADREDAIKKAQRKINSKSSQISPTKLPATPSSVARQRERVRGHAFNSQEAAARNTDKSRCSRLLLEKLLVLQHLRWDKERQGGGKAGSGGGRSIFVLRYSYPFCYSPLPVQDFLCRFLFPRGFSHVEISGLSQQPG